MLQLVPAGPCWLVRRCVVQFPLQHNTVAARCSSLQVLADAHPSDIPELLGPILAGVRMIWSLSRFYNTPERITVRAGATSAGL
jgi:hypothetical protein